MEEQEQVAQQQMQQEPMQQMPDGQMSAPAPGEMMQPADQMPDGMQQQMQMQQMDPGMGEA